MKDLSVKSTAKEDIKKKTDKVNTTNVQNKTKINNYTKPSASCSRSDLKNTTDNHATSSQTRSKQAISDSSCSTKSKIGDIKRKSSVDENKRFDNVSSDSTGPSPITKSRYQPYKKPKQLNQEKQKSESKNIFTSQKSNVNENKKLNPFLKCNFKISELKPYNESYPPEPSIIPALVTPVQRVDFTSSAGTKENVGITLFNQFPGNGTQDETEEESMDVDDDIQISQTVIKEVILLL